MEFAKSVVGETLKSFLVEDLGYGDVTTDSLVDPSLQASGTIICREHAVIAGLLEARTLLEMVGCTGTSTVTEGERVEKGTKILKVSGSASSLLRVERTLLNLLSHMSGVATTTSELVELAKKTGKGKVRIACTRKTLPGLRYFEKRAVAIAGGDTHRLRLDDEVLIKDNHLVIAGTITECVKRARAKVSFTKKIEVEITKPPQAVEAAEAGADIILLDNMKPDDVERAIVALREKHLRDRVILEASGGIRKENLAAYAKTGVDVISIGMITHSAKSVDMSMAIKPAPGTR